MGEKRKQDEASAAPKKEEVAQERPKRTLLGWKDGVSALDAERGVPRASLQERQQGGVQESEGATLNEFIELRNCSSCLFFDCRKQKDLYRWMVKCPSGPSVKFLVNAVYTMEELKLTGNHLKRSHPILTFSSNFDKVPCIFFCSQVLAYCFIFSIPKDHWKVKPFHDHVFVFPIVDDHIRFCNYQISVPHNEIDKVDRSIEEI
ncbi:unnamed protein product [Musa acuminata subsp. malaccensis]|uniref:(wild Malaysian banana) hypothetical protein n=1 Tax=Musa acuminata subsp. malaccensis TaxID=214687 RepID=A0A804I3L4_MUSAM|nr:unnamed protein product [Musa acuminata subsp. malaccensis]